MFTYQNLHLRTNILLKFNNMKRFCFDFCQTIDSLRVNPHLYQRMHSQKMIFLIFFRHLVENSQIKLIQSLKNILFLGKMTYGPYIWK